MECTGEDDRQRILDAMDDAEREYDRLTRAPTPSVGPRPPSWWPGDDAASDEAFASARSAAARGR